MKRERVANGVIDLLIYHRVDVYRFVLYNVSIIPGRNNSLCKACNLNCKYSDGIGTLTTLIEIVLVYFCETMPA